MSEADNLLRALDAFAADTGTTCEIGQDRKLNFFELGNLDLLFNGGDKQLWVSFHQLVEVCHFHPSEYSDAWTMAAEGDGVAELAWKRDDGSDGRLRLIEMWAATMCAAQFGPNAEKIFNCLAPTLHRGLIQSGLADSLTGFAVEISEDGTPRATGEEKPMRELLGTSPSAEVAHHALAQGVHAAGRPDRDRLYAVDVSQMFGEGDVS